MRSHPILSLFLIVPSCFFRVASKDLVVVSGKMGSFPLFPRAFRLASDFFIDIG